MAQTKRDNINKIKEGLSAIKRNIEQLAFAEDVNFKKIQQDLNNVIGNNLTQQEFNSYRTRAIQWINGYVTELNQLKADIASLNHTNNVNPDA